MDSVVVQLGLNSTFWWQFGIFFVAFLVLPRIFFMPFHRLIVEREERTQKDMEKAVVLREQTQKMWADYRAAVGSRRQALRQALENQLSDVKKTDDAYLNKVREEVRKEILVHAASLDSQTQALQRSLEADVESYALQVADQIARIG